MNKFKFLFVFFFLFLFFNHVQANEKIAFIDINFIFNNSNAGKDLKKKISKKNDDLQTLITSYKVKIDKKRKTILSQKNVLSAEEYKNKISDLEKEVQKVNTIISQKRNELKLYQKKIENNFSKNLNSMIEDFSIKNSIDIILKKENLLMAKKNLDITEQIFNLFNEKIKVIDIK